MVPNTTRSNRATSHKPPPPELQGLHFKPKPKPKPTASPEPASTDEDEHAQSSSGAAPQAQTEPTSPVAPLAPYPPVPPGAGTRSRAPEFYGFVAWTGTYLLFCAYLLWAFLPDALIQALGVSWYPNREWALLVPAYGMVLVLLTYFTYFALALAGTPSFSDPRTITDSRAHYPLPTDARESPHATPRLNLNPYRAHARPDAVPELYDVPLGLVNRIVYRRRAPTRGADADAGALSPGSA